VPDVADEADQAAILFQKGCAGGPNLPFDFVQCGVKSCLTTCSPPPVFAFMVLCCVGVRSCTHSWWLQGAPLTQSAARLDCFFQTQLQKFGCSVEILRGYMQP
jgi:hypothetical protein